MNTYDGKERVQEYLERFRGMSNDQLIDAFNREVGCTGWTGARAAYLVALRQEFEGRGYDYSAVGDKRPSFWRKIKLLDNKLIFDEGAGR